MNGEIKSEIILQVVQFSSQAVTSVFHLRSESFSFSDFFKGQLLSGRQLLLGFKSKLKIYMLPLESLFWGGRGGYFGNSMVVTSWMGHLAQRWALPSVGKMVSTNKISGMPFCLH